MSYNATAYLPANATASFFGGADKVFVGAGDNIRADHDEIDIGGGSVTETITGGDNDILSPSGNNLIISNGNDPTRDIVNTGGSKIVALDKSNLLVVGLYNTVEMHNGANVQVSGSTLSYGTNITGTLVTGWGNQIWGTNGDNISIKNVGTLPDDVIHLTNGVVNLLSSTNATVISVSTYINGGPNDRITLGPGNGGSTITAPNSAIYIDTTINFGNDVINSSGDTITANGAHFWLTANQYGTLSGTGNVVSLERFQEMSDRPPFDPLREPPLLKADEDLGRPLRSGLN